MNDLVNNGTNPKEAGNLVSQAATQAYAEGLKGKDGSPFDKQEIEVIKKLTKKD